MTRTPKGLRLHIAFVGRRNAGKSSLLNALVRQEVSIVSPVAGTTTDPVEKPMELLPIGPVLLIDTAGLDDTGALGGMRMVKSKQVLDRTDVAVLVTESGRWEVFEQELLDALRARNVPVIVVLNKTDLVPGDEALTKVLQALGVRVVAASALNRQGLGELRQALLDSAPAEFLDAPPLIRDLVEPGDLALLVTPIDNEAPKGRIKLLQVQAIRDLLDHGAMSLVVKETELAQALVNLRQRPKLVVTDAQAFELAAAVVPRDVRLTAFSVLMARSKGDLRALAHGAMAIRSLKNGDRILMAETCTHHPIEDDIGRVKIPAWLRQRTGAELEFHHVQGHDFPTDLRPYALVVHCGACMWNRREVLGRIARCQQDGVPMTNYGLAIAECFGILERALEPFPGIWESVKTEHSPFRAAPRDVATLAAVA